MTSSSSSVTAVSTNNSTSTSRFGLIGSFGGDDAILDKLQKLRHRLLQGAINASVTTDEIRWVLSSVPFSGRVEFCAKCLINSDMTAAAQQQNGQLIIQLFRQCFDTIGAAMPGSTKTSGNAGKRSSESGSEDEWVIISLCSETAANSASSSSSGNELLYLKSSNYYVLHALVAALQSFGSVSVSLFDEYFSRTTSTVFRSPFVKSMVSLPVHIFSDERLERVYQSSVEAVRRSIESECKLLNGQRSLFLSRLISSGATPNASELIHYATTESLEQELLRSVQVVSNPTVHGKTLSVVSSEWRWSLNWPLHFSVYLRFLSSHLQRHASDPIWCGRFLTEFTSHINTRLPAEVALSLFGFYQTYRPLFIQSQVPRDVKEYLIELSREGLFSKAAQRDASNQVEIEYAGLERLAPTAIVLKSVAAGDRWSALKSMLIRTKNGLAFSPSSVDLCVAILNDLSKKPDYHQPISQFTMELLAALSQQEFFNLIFNSPNAAPATDLSAANTIRPFLNAAFACPHIRFSKPVLKSWLNLHLTHLPTQAVSYKEFSGRTEEALWNQWRDSVNQIFQRRLAIIASKALKGLRESSVRTPLTPITSYVGYTAILAEQMLQPFQHCKDFASPIEFVSAILPIVEFLSPLLSESAIAPLYPPIDRSKESSSAPGLSAITAVRAAGDQFALLAMSALQRALTFDLNSSRYAQVTSSSILPLLNRLGSLTNLERFPSLASALFGFYTSILESAKIPEAIQKLGFVMVRPSEADQAKGKKKITWIHINSNHHQQSTQMAMDKLAVLCTAAKTVPALTALAENAWKMVRGRYFNSSPILPAVSSSSSSVGFEQLKQAPAFNNFLAACGTLPASIVATEKPLLLQSLTHHLRANTFHNASSGSTIDGWWSLLLAAVDACGADWPSRNSWLLKFDNIGLPAVRECLQQSTHDRDPQVRLQAYLQLLRVSISTSWQEFAISVEFVQKRTKNEAGLYRRDLYQMIAGEMLGVVGKSLTVPNGSSSDTASFEEKSLANVQLLTESCVQILRDDISKRDSVAKNIFQSMGRTIIQTVVSFAAPSLLPIRRAWITCGMTLDWLLLRNNSGEDACRKYVWPVQGCVFPQQQSITEECLMNKIQSAVLNGLKGGPTTFAALRQQVYAQNKHVHVASKDLYTPEQAVELLVSSMLGMRQQADDKPVGYNEVRSCDFLVDGAFFPTAKIEGDAAATAQAETNPALAGVYESNTLQCIQRLIGFCGPRWTSVPWLVSFFDSVVSTVADSKHANHPLFAAHCYQTHALFKAVHQLYRDGDAWYEIPSLSRACSILFESAIRRSMVTDASKLRPVWTEVKMHKGKITTAHTLSTYEIGFLVSNVNSLRGRQALPGSPSLTKSERLSLDKSDTSERAATVLRDLLAISPSALHLIWPELLASRDDIFSTYLGRTRGELYGVFDPQANSALAGLPSKVASEMVWFPITSVQLVSMNDRAMQTFTRMCMERAMNQSLSASIRSAAITQFVESPTASHSDVIALLKKLHAIIAKRTKIEKEAKQKKESAAAASTSASAAAEIPDGSADQEATDDAVDLLLESVILRVFQTDATWFILAYLFSPEVISSAPQRTTAAILTNLRLWAPIDRTVAVLRVLLEPRRRWAIGLFLHKQILRLLFECSDNNQVARDLFIAEWKQRNAAETKMTTDVRHEVIKMCVPVLNEGNEDKQSLAWSIVEDLVTDSQSQPVDPTTIVLLFAPTWQPSPAIACANLDANASLLSTLMRTNTPPRVFTAGVESPQSFGYFHSQLTQEPISTFQSNTRQMCEKMAKLMGRLGSVTANPHVRMLSQLQQFVFSSSMEGLPDDSSIDRLHQLLMKYTVDAEISESQPASSTLPATLSVELDHTTDYSLQVVPRLFAGLSLQVLIRAFVTQFPAERDRTAEGFTHLCRHHPYAIRLRDSVGRLLTSLLQSSPSQAERRMRVSKGVLALLNQVSQTSLPPSSAPSSSRPSSWAVELYQAPFKELLNFLRQDSQQYASLPPGVEKKD